MTRFCDWLNALIQDTRGNVAMIAGLCMPVLLTAVSGAIDFSRSTAIGSELQSALDSGVLAAASLSQDRDPEAVVRAYIEAALNDYPDLIDSLQLTVTSDISLNSRQVGAVAEVASPTLMLGMVGINSMIIQRSSEAIEAVRNVEISLVLDISGSMRGSKMNAMVDAASEFVEVVLGADTQNRTSVSVIPYNGGVRTPRDVNDTLINGSNNQRRRSGCVDLSGDSQRGYNPANIRGVPAAISPLLPEREYEWIRWNNNEQRDNRNSSHCPESDEASLFITDDEPGLQRLIGNLDAGGNTGLDVATAWGAKALDPLWRGRLGGRFNDRPSAYDDPDTIKILVVMTDGAATAQYRTYRSGNRWRTYQQYNARRARENMARACDLAEDNGVEIYTIAFQLSGSTNRNLMRNCANRPQNYYQVEGLNIQEAFSAIAAEINQLRLKR